MDWPALVPLRLLSCLSPSHIPRVSIRSSEKHPARPDSPGPSMGIIVAKLTELELEKDRGRMVTRRGCRGNSRAW